DCGKIGRAPYHSVKCDANCIGGRVGRWGISAARGLVLRPPLTAGKFCLHNGFTMLRRFDRKLAISDRTTRSEQGPDRSFRGAGQEDREGGGGSKTGTETIVRPKSKPKTQKPSLYR